MKKLFLTLTAVLMLFFALTACEHAHNYGEWETTKEPSCLEEGTKVRHCACLEQESETIPALGHTFDQRNVGDKYLKSGATEDSPALYYFSCRCGEKGVDTFSVGNALGGNGDGAHVFRNEWTYDDEKHWRSCIDLSCDARTNEAAHTFGEWVVDKAATCMKTGSKHHDCVVCGKSVSETIPIDATAHNYSAAWTTDGTNHWHKCQNSGCTSVKDKTAHSFGEWIVDTAATCQKTGTHHHVCTVCNKSVSETIPVDATAHNYATTWTTDNSSHWHKCLNSGCTSISGKTTHTFGEWIVDAAATCMKSGMRHKECACGYKTASESYTDSTAHNYSTAWIAVDDTYHEHKCQNSGCTSVVDKTAHSGGSICSACNRFLSWGDNKYIRINKDGAKDAEGTYILFGEYPQSLKADSVTITTTQDSRGYYLGSDGFYYAKVTATPYSSGYKFSSGTTVTNSTVYYFKIEPIRWRILSEDGDTALIFCDSIIANKRFGSSNNYKNSEIRAWLNDQFYNTAFNTLQKDLINTVLVDNSVASTGYSSNKYACEDTSDNVFLLSYKEVTNSAYYTARKMTVSDYARATGARMSNDSGYYGNGWWLRSPYYYGGSLARAVYDDGGVGYDYVNHTYYGVVPALQIRLR